MNLNDFYQKYPILRDPSKKFWLSNEFLLNIYFPLFGEDGLDLIEPEARFYNETDGENYDVDFLVKTQTNLYSIECDGLYAHAESRVTPEYYEKLNRKDEYFKAHDGIKRFVRYTKDQICDDSKKRILNMILLDQ